MNAILTRKAYSGWINSAALLFILAIAAFLFAGHGTHLLAYSGYMVFFACMLMHLFMHGGHGGHGSHSRTAEGSHVHNSSGDDNFDIDRAKSQQDIGQHEQGPEAKQ